MPSVDHLEVLIIKLSGGYGHASSGNGDARYMTAITKAAISFTEPFGLIFDFTELTYEWGDTMAEVLSAGNDCWTTGQMPLAIVVSQRCETAIKSLLTEELLFKDLSLLHRNLESALSYIGEKNRIVRSKFSG